MTAGLVPVQEGLGPDRFVVGGLGWVPWIEPLAREDLTERHIDALVEPERAARERRVRRAHHQQQEGGGHRHEPTPGLLPGRERCREEHGPARRRLGRRCDGGRHW